MVAKHNSEATNTPKNSSDLDLKVTLTVSTGHYYKTPPRSSASILSSRLRQAHIHFPHMSHSHFFYIGSYLSSILSSKAVRPLMGAGASAGDVARAAAAAASQSDSN